jgi:hypothetical protein
MITMIINALFSFTLFITGGHVIDTKFGLHHYSDEDYKEIFFLQSPDSISKKCIKHSVVEKISYKIFIVRVKIKGIMKYLTHIQYKINHKKIPLIVRGVTNSKR